MIKFEKGEFVGGDSMDIIYDETRGVSFDDYYHKPLTEDCCILEIKDRNNIKLFRADNRGIDFIPDEFENDAIGYDIFWNSEVTLVFPCLKNAILFMQNYEGLYEIEINELCEEVIDSQIRDTAYYLFTNIDGFAEEIDVDFLNELEEIVDSSNISMDSILSSMKFLILNRYKLKIEEERLSLLN